MRAWRRLKRQQNARAIPFTSASKIALARLTLAALVALGGAVWGFGTMIAGHKGGGVAICIAAITIGGMLIGGIRSHHGD
jgi:hypothetical protein